MDVEREDGDMGRVDGMEYSDEDLLLGHGQVPHGIPPATPSSKLPHMELAQIIKLTCAFSGIQFVWGLQIGWSSSTFLTLGMPQKFVSYAWLAGPISGILVQPIVGTLSDRCTHRWGRRRPYIVAGLLCILAGMLLFSNGESIGLLLGDSDGHHPIGLTLCVTAFYLIDFALNVVQGPLRTLLADVTPSSQHAVGNAWFAFMAGIGNALGSFVGSAHLTPLFPFLGSDLRIIYCVGMLYLTASVLLCVLSTHERRYELPEGVQVRSARDTIVDMFRSIKRLPVAIRRVFIVQNFTWFAWFTVFMYAAVYFGEQVYDGDPDADKHTHARDVYNKGVRMANLGLGISALVSVAYAPLLPRLVRVLGLKSVYTFSQVVQGTCLLSTLFVTRVEPAVSFLALLGLAMATTLTVPWTVTSVAVADRSDAGILMATMNLSQCFPEIAAALFGYVVLETATHNNAWVLASGGICAFIGAALIPMLIVDNVKHTRH